jgi:hypothetical protein
MAHGTIHTNVCKIFNFLPDKKNTGLSALAWRPVATTGVRASVMKAIRRSRQSCGGHCLERPGRNLRPLVASPSMLVGSPYARTASGRVLTGRIVPLPAGARARAVGECLGNACTLLVRLQQVRRVCTYRSAPRTTRTLRRLASAGQVR